LKIFTSIVKGILEHYRIKKNKGITGIQILLLSILFIVVASIILLGVVLFNLYFQKSTAEFEEGLEVTPAQLNVNDEDAKPVTLKKIPSCTSSSWSCGLFGECSGSGQQTRNCILIDTKCSNPDLIKPGTVQSCTSDIDDDGKKRSRKRENEEEPQEQQICTPTTEVCDSRDNDCDDEIDENLIISTSELGACSINTETCIEGVYTPNNEYNPIAEICNNIDDNCDGIVDEGITCVCNPGETRSCGENDIGACSYGTQTCQSDHRWNICIGEMLPSNEICDNIDNDCDDEIDENLIRSTSELGACSINTETCIEGVYTPNNEYNPIAEICNNIDDNCDGIVDEGNVCVFYTQSDVKVLVMSYFPLQGSNLDQSITGISDSLSSIRNKVIQLTTNTVNALTQGSTYHLYKDSNSESFLKYTVIDNKEFLKQEPVSTNEIPWNPGIFRPDYHLMLSNDVDICDYVDNQGVKEVWIWGYHFGIIEPSESNMAMGTASEAYWNHGSYGDVSNSEEIDDLPTCTKSYTLYNYNYARGLGEALENHGHHIESMFRFVDISLWNKFQYPYGEPIPTVNSCGWTHSGPNTKEQYEPGWTSETTVKSNCEDWHPDGSGEVKDVNCHTWYGETCLENGGVDFKIWWMQNIPGLNNGLTYQGKEIKNWWIFIADFDQAISQGKSLTS